MSMKQIVPLILAVLVGMVIGYFFAKELPSSKPPQEFATKSLIDSSGLSVDSFGVYADCSDPLNQMRLTRDETEIYLCNYLTKMGYDPAIPATNSGYFLYDIPTMKCLLDHLEKIGSTHLRVYNGIVGPPAGGRPTDWETKHVNMSVLMFKGALLENATTNSYVDVPMPKGAFSYNHAHQCPPYCNSSLIERVRESGNCNYTSSKPSR